MFASEAVLSSQLFFFQADFGTHGREQLFCFKNVVKPQDFQGCRKTTTHHPAPPNTRHLALVAVQATKSMLSSQFSSLMSKLSSPSLKPSLITTFWRQTRAVTISKILRCFRDTECNFVIKTTSFTSIVIIKGVLWILVKCKLFKLHGICKKIKSSFKENVNHFQRI